MSPGPTSTTGPSRFYPTKRKNLLLYIIPFKLIFTVINSLHPLYVTVGPAVQELYEGTRERHRARIPEALSFKIHHTILEKQCESVRRSATRATALTITIINNTITIINK